MTTPSAAREQAVERALDVQPAEKRRAHASYWADAAWRFSHDPTAMVAFAVLVLLVLLAAAADVLAQHLFHTTYARQDLLRTFQKPTLSQPAYWFGADDLGRSEIVRLLYGARVSLFVGLFGAAVSLTIGVTLGMTAGYFRGWWDDIVVWLVTTLENIPLIFLLILVGVYFHLGPLSLAILIGALAWVGLCNITRGQTFAVRERDYVLAARTIGASSPRILFGHILPNILPLTIIVAMLNAGGFILAEAALSFLGLGIQPPVPSWGNMLSGATQFYYNGPHLIIVPGIAVTVTVLCFFVIGDGLRDALDPRLRNSGGS
jgi:ABC-type dipeptide/oligopeptide/nickel transport system permease subunit